MNYTWANKTVGKACLETEGILMIYNLNVNNCEILKVTERFMVEAFVEVNKNI